MDVVDTDTLRGSSPSNWKRRMVLRVVEGGSSAVRSGDLVGDAWVVWDAAASTPPTDLTGVHSNGGWDRVPDIEIAAVVADGSRIEATHTQMVTKGDLRPWNGVDMWSRG